MPVTGLQELRDREDIRDVIAAYARAIDRRDRALLASVFWDDGVSDYAVYRGPNPGFVDWAMERTAQFSRSQHMLGQSLIKLAGARASAETYFSALQTYLDPKPTCTDEAVAGRYVDRFEKRDGEWRIRDRVVAFEWYRHFPETGAWNPAVPRVVGAREPDDISYSFFKGFID